MRSLCGVPWLRCVERLLEQGALCKGVPQCLFDPLQLRHTRNHLLELPALLPSKSIIRLTLPNG